MFTVEQILPSVQEKLVTVKTDALLIDAAKLLNDPRHNLVIVCDNSGRMAGVITKTDIVGRISHCTGCSCTMAASHVMTREVTFCRPSDWLREVWSIVKQRGLKNIPVVDRDTVPLGVLNARDMVRVLLEDSEHEESLLRDYVMGIGYR
ncbi:Putative manganese-dependent inorganic pyrophosphatase OS=Afipia felis OX=1035 GN=NCTC12722_01675 PE=4 SV=1 [Afipia felis]